MQVLLEHKKLRSKVNVEMPSVIRSKVLVRGAFAVRVEGQHPELKELTVIVCNVYIECGDCREDFTVIETD